jgi:amino acid transporter
MSDTSPPKLVRAIGRWTLAALVVNSIIGSGIFGLPDDIARFVGPAAPFAYLIAAAGIGVYMACFAEVSSQFREAGGPYLYAREALGRFAGIQMGWLAWLVRLTSAAANANLFVDYLGGFWRNATSLAPRAIVLALLLGGLCAVNVRGVKAGARLSNFFTVAKLLPMAILIVAGLYFVGGNISVGAAPAGSQWLQALLALMFAYGGFESALMPMGEAKNPRRDAPFALFVALATCAVVYTSIHLVVMGALADPGAIRERPIADAAGKFLGHGGELLIALGAMISTYGYLSGQFVSAPRVTYALAEQKDFPGFFASVHPRFRTPYRSIIIYTVIVLALAVRFNFLWNAILSTVGRLLTYGIVCVSLIALRVRRPNADAFRVPAGRLFALVGIGLCVLLVLQMERVHFYIVLALTGLALVNWLLLRFRSTGLPAS